MLLCADPTAMWEPAIGTFFFLVKKKKKKLKAYIGNRARESLHWTCSNIFIQFLEILNKKKHRIKASPQE